MTKTKKIVLTSLFAALCCIGTLLHIPAGPALGYIHLGDALVLLSGLLLGPVYGGLGAGIGSMLADLLNGYAIYAPATFIIKALCAMVCGGIFALFKKKHQNQTGLHITLLIGGILAEALMIGLYFIFETGMYFVMQESSASLLACAGTAALAIPYNAVQAVAAIILSNLLIPIFLRINDFREIMN